MGMLYAGIPTGILSKSWNLTRSTKTNQRCPIEHAGCSSTPPPTQSGERSSARGRSRAWFPVTSETLSSATLCEKFGAIPVSAWEEELPILEAYTRESQRVSLCNIALRMNLREEMKIGERVVKRGDILAYSFADVHLNPEYYSEPYKYDPGRWLRPDPVPSAVYPFLGWGAGRHPCSGMKAAKLEMKLILAMFLTRYEFDLVDGDGKFPDPLPVPNRNDTHRVRAGLWIGCSGPGTHRVSPFPLSLGPSPWSCVLLQF